MLVRRQERGCERAAAAALVLIYHRLVNRHKVTRRALSGNHSLRNTYKHTFQLVVAGKSCTTTPKRAAEMSNPGRRFIQLAHALDTCIEHRTRHNWREQAGARVYVRFLPAPWPLVSACKQPLFAPAAVGTGHVLSISPVQGSAGVCPSCTGAL